MATRRSSRLSSSSFLPSQPDSKPTITASTSKKRKATATIDQDGFAIPSTPKRAKVNKKSTLAPPETPTPAAAKEMGISYSNGDIKDGTPPLGNRLANPFATNAPLISPMSSRLVSLGSDIKTETKLPPSLSSGTDGVSKFESTTDQILEEALSHLIKMDPRLEPVIEKHKCGVFSKEGLMEAIDPFRSLCSGIISQQVSETIFHIYNLTPIQLINFDISPPLFYH